MAALGELFSAWLASHNLLASSLENLFHLECLCGPVIAIQSENFADHSTARLALNMDDVIDGLSDLGFNVLEGGLRVATQYEVCKAA
jgi:hypothetical protein